MNVDTALKRADGIYHCKRCSFTANRLVSIRMHISKIHKPKSIEEREAMYISMPLKASALGDEVLATLEQHKSDKSTPEPDEDKKGEIPFNSKLTQWDLEIAKESLPHWIKIIAFIEQLQHLFPRG